MARAVSFTPSRFLKRIWQLGALDVSPDGRLLVYSANKGDQWSLYAKNLGTGRERVLAKSEQALLNPEISMDGAWVAFQADFEGDENSDLYRIPTKGGETKRLTDHPMDDANPRWSPDGRSLAFISNRNGDRENVFVMPSSGGEARQLTFEDDIVQEIAWRPDSSGIAFGVGVGDRNWVGHVDLRGKVERIADFPDSESDLAGEWQGKPEPWSPDGRELAFVSNVHDHLDLGVFDFVRRRVRWIVRNRWDKALPTWSPRGDRIAYTENHDGNVQIKTVGRNGRGARGLSPAKGVARRPRWLHDGSGLLYEHSTSVRPPRILLQKGARRTVLVDSVRGSLPTEEFAEARLVRYRSFDGKRIPGWLYMPRKSRYRNAALVEPHGGPEAQVLNEWDPGSQFLAARGFAILYPNYRGGTGYGRAWRRLSDRDLGGADMKDIIEGGRWLVRNGICPKDRLGIIGTSYGGYAVAHCLEQAPDLWAVGVSIVGFFNWFTATQNERGNLEKYDRFKMGAPKDDTERFRRFSPIFFLDSIRAPVLFTGGAHDPRCPVTEARRMVREMQETGKVVDYLEFPDEGHWPRKTSNQIRLYDRAISWLERHLPDA